MFHSSEASSPTDLVLPALRFGGDELFHLIRSESLPGSHARATLSVNYAPSNEAKAKWGEDGRWSGPGIYGCFWDGRLFYVGTYAGNGPDPRIGNVARERWAKHVAGMTFRGRKLGMAPRWLDKIVSEHDGPLAQLLATADRAVVTRDKGLQTQYSKFCFAERHWADFDNLSDEMLARFAFIYLRPSLAYGFKGMQKSALDPHLRRMEKTIIDSLDPPCNSQSARSDGQPTAVIETAETEMRSAMSTYIAGLEGNF